MITARITTEEPFPELEKLFRPELERQHARSTVAIAEEDGKAVFDVTAEDVTALRAAVNGITSVLRAWEATNG